MPEDLEVNGTSAPPPPPQNDGDNTTPPKIQSHSVDPDAQEMVISSLRTQIQDLFSQVNELNNKLVKSYDRVSDLEDDLHVASANLRTSSVRISQLELERTEHLAALNTGLLVEKSHVTTELTRLMEKATEEAAQRGQAESARAAIEKDLDDLSASLFGQANNMVAEARLAQHRSEQKVIEAQRALKGAEEAVSIMQSQMQALQAEKEEADRKSQEMQAKMGKGKWLERIQSVDLSHPFKLMSSHLPYQEFLLFAAHLRALHQTSLTPPAMTTILPLPFLSRLSNEDSDPTIRLDLAPSLNWLSRRSVLSAIHTGQLTIEPISVASLLSESTLYSSPMTVAGLSNNNDAVSCALCGSAISAVAEYVQNRAQRPSSFSHNHSVSWSGSFFKKTPNRTPSIMSNSSSHPSSPAHTQPPTGEITTPSQNNSQQVYIFRVAAQPSTSISSLPIPSSIAKSLSQGSTPSASSPPYLTPMGSMSGATATASSSPNNQAITIYPLCSSGWCLKRLRTTCTLWAYVRTGIVEKIWEEELAFVTPPPPPASVPVASSAASEKPPLPPRKRGLWGLASAIGERAASWSDSDKDKKKPASAPPGSSPPSASATQPPPLPPRRDPVGRRLPPPPTPEKEAAPPSVQSESSSTPSAVPPPLPKRSEGRKRTPTTKQLTLNGHNDHGSLPSSPTTPTNKLLFDAGVPQSPLKSPHSPLPDADASAAPEAPSESGGVKPEAVKTPEVKAAVELPPTPTSPLKVNRLSFARNVPLPDSRPATPSGNASTAGAEVTSPPSRTASPAIVPNGGTPPPLPRRAAARRAVPNPPSRPETPQQSETKPQEAAANGDSGEKVTEVKEESVKAEEEKKVEAQDTDDTKPEASKEVITDSEHREEGKENGVVESSSGGVDEKDDGKMDTPEPAAASKDEATEGADTVDRSAQSTPDVFVDALTPAATQQELSSAIPDPDVSTIAQLTAEPLPNGTAAEHDKAGGLNGDAVVKDDEPEKPLVPEPTTQDEEADPNDKEVYIGEATWEERTWKELVRLREEMFWARIGGSR